MLGTCCLDAPLTAPTSILPSAFWLRLFEGFARFSYAINGSALSSPHARPCSATANDLEMRDVCQIQARHHDIAGVDRYLIIAAIGLDF